MDDEYLCWPAQVNNEMTLPGERETKGTEETGEICIERRWGGFSRVLLGVCSGSGCWSFCISFASGLLKEVLYRRLETMNVFVGSTPIHFLRTNSKNQISISVEVSHGGPFGCG